jgi:hypothetical protein
MPLVILRSSKKPSDLIRSRLFFRWLVAMIDLIAEGQQLR